MATAPANSAALPREPGTLCRRELACRSGAGENPAFATSWRTGAPSGPFDQEAGATNAATATAPAISVFQRFCAASMTGIPNASGTSRGTAPTPGPRSRVSFSPSTPDRR